MIGSGNIGATNVLRTGRKELAAILTLLLDAAKGAVAVLVVGHDMARSGCRLRLPAIVAGAFAFLGHVYPAWLRFRGGKGVATFLGIALALSWPCGSGLCARLAGGVRGDAAQFGRRHDRGDRDAGDRRGAQPVRS